MRFNPRLIAAGILLTSSPLAFASNPDGLLTLIVGIPLLFIASVVLGIILAFRTSKNVRLVAVVLFVPTLAYSLYVALDAVTMLKDLGSENSMIGLTFLGLLAFACILFFLIVRQRDAA